jgi:ketosteroid isomerase-like protein
MAHPSEDLLRRIYEAAGNGDLQTLLDALTDDIIWQDSTLGPLAGEYRGKHEVLAFFGKMADVYAGTLRLEVEDVLVNDRHGVVSTREEGESAGEAVAWAGVQVWTFRDGRCAHFLAVNDRTYNRFWLTHQAASTPAPQPSTSEPSR